MSRIAFRSTLIAVAAAFLAAGCSTAPKTQAERQSLVAEAEAAVQTMTAKDSSLKDFLDRAYGYAIFPNVGKGGIIAGGAYGRGVVFEQGRPVGYAELNQASIGAQIGGQSFSELIVFENKPALDRLKAGDIDIGAEASAVALNAGAAGAASFQGGMAIFQLPKGGLMASAAIAGQKINFQPMSDAEADTAADQSRQRTEIQTERRTEREADGDSEVRVKTEMRPIRDNSQPASQQQPPAQQPPAQQ
jgi:lipid-binding SYLF domain-containing protein